MKNVKTVRMTSIIGTRLTSGICELFCWDLNRIIDLGFYILGFGLTSREWGVGNSGPPLGIRGNGEWGVGKRDFNSCVVSYCSGGLSNILLSADL